MVKFSRSFLGGIGLGIVALVYLFETFKLPFGSTKSPDMGFVPLLIGVVFLGCCLLLTIVNYCLPNRSESKSILNEEDTKETSDYKKPFLIIIALLLYPLFFVKFGFIISTIPMLYIILRIMQYKTWWNSLLVAVTTIIVIYFVFAVWLGVYFPAGILD